MSYLPPSRGSRRRSPGDDESPEQTSQDSGTPDTESSQEQQPKDSTTPKQQDTPGATGGAQHNGDGDGDSEDAFADEVLFGSGRDRSDDPPVRSRAEAKKVEAERIDATGGGALRRSLGLVALGTVIPGLGLSMTRRRWVGIPLVVLAVAGIVAGLWYVNRHGALSTALELAAQPSLLRTVAVGLVVGALIWIGSIVLTAVTTKPRRLTGARRGTLVAFTGLMCLAVAGPAAMGLRYIDAHTDAAERIFTGRPPSESGDGGRGNVAAPNLEEEDPWADVPRVNVLMLGTDVADGREGVRTDSMIVASIDTTTGDMVLFGVPRNLQNVPIPAGNPLSTLYPNGYDCGDECLMNGIWTEAEALAEAHLEYYEDDPEPGATATREVISAVIGQPITYTVIVDLAGFEALVDAMGGVHIDVSERLPMGGRMYDEGGHMQMVPGSESGWLEPGPQQLTGYEALWYARSRVTTDDFSRMRRQRCVVAAVVDQVNPITMLTRYPELAAAAGDSIKVNIAEEELRAWADLVQRVQGGSMQSLPFTTDNINVVNPDYAAMRLMVHEALNPPEPEEPTTSPTSSGGRTSTPSPTEDETAEETPDTDPEPTERPDDELADVGAVC